MYEDPCIVNNLLCYIKCKMDILQSDLLVKVCADTFSETDIAEAQTLLHRFVKPSERLQKRKGDDMKSKPLFDILKWLHEADDSDVPYFVCDNVNILPSIDVHDTDVSLLMKEISVMRYPYERVHKYHGKVARFNVEFKWPSWSYC